MVRPRDSSWKSEGGDCTSRAPSTRSSFILGLMLGGGEEPAPPPAEEEETQVIPEHTRKVPKRRGPSDDWPRVYIELVPPEVEREGLDAFDVIGQESRGVLERRPASCVFVEVDGYLIVVDQTTSPSSTSA